MAPADTDSTPGKSPAFQFYPNEFLADANVIVMSLQERGAYITLLCVCWQQGTLPSDPTRLARLCGVPLPAFRRLWPALEPCFRPEAGSDRLVHPRLERERQKQAEFKRRQSDNGKKGGRPQKPDESQNNPSLSSGLSQTKPKKSSSSSSSSSSSFAGFSQKSAVVVDARSKRPIFKGQRFVVFEWMLDDLSRMLGEHVEAFDLHAGFYELDARAAASGEVVPQRDGGKWLQEQTHDEAVRRGLLASEHKSKLTVALEKASQW